MKTLFLIVLIAFTLTDDGGGGGGLQPTEITKPTESIGNDESKLITRDVFKEAYRMHGMTNLEIMEAFTMADINKDGALSKDEYKAFHQFFVAKFNNCANEDYMIDVAQMEACVFNDISIKSIA